MDVIYCNAQHVHVFYLFKGILGFPEVTRIEALKLLCDRNVTVIHRRHRPGVAPPHSFREGPLQNTVAAASHISVHALSGRFLSRQVINVDPHEAAKVNVVAVAWPKIIWEKYEPSLGNRTRQVVWNSSTRTECKTSPEKWAEGSLPVKLLYIISVL